MTRAVLAVPGDLATPTGGYAYAGRLLGAAQAAGLALEHLALPAGFPVPTEADLAEAGRRLRQVDPALPIIVDGLAFGVMAGVVADVASPLIALCHHPLGLETGLEARRAAELLESERQALRHAAGVITTSAATAEILVERLGVPTDRITVARPGTDRPSAPPQRRHHDGPVRLLSVGSLVPRKGHDVLLDALARLGDLDWHLTLVGDARDAETAAALDRQVTDNGLSGKVRMAGALDCANLQAAYAAADLFVLASRYEGYGMAYTEAMVWGLPVVGCETGAVAEATLGAARLVPTDDPGALADALRPLIASPASRAALAQATERAARALPTWADTAQAVLTAIRWFQPADARS